MKTNIIFPILLILLAATIAACQPLQTEPINNQSPERAIPEQAEETAYPITEQEYTAPQIEAAYPITEEDIQMLIGTWSLIGHSADGVPQDPDLKTLHFKVDGSYEMITETETVTGQWSTRLLAIESTLILETDTGERLNIQITDLSDSLLSLTYYQDGMFIEEDYQPAI